MQAKPHPEFGGTAADGLHHLELVKAFVSIKVQRTTAEHMSEVGGFEEACSRAARNQAAIDAAWDALPSQAYSLIEQRTPAWFELRQRVPVTGSRVWDLLGLSLMPGRSRGEFQSLFSAPFYRRGAPHISCWTLSCQNAAHKRTLYADDRACQTGNGLFVMGCLVSACRSSRGSFDHVRGEGRAFLTHQLD